MRDKIRAFYYPDFWVQAPTLKKAILVFDEIHFMDRPSFMFGGGREGSVGMVGAASPIRPYEQSFRDNGVPLYVHEAPGGPPQSELLEKVEADLSDLNFMTRFQEGLRASQHFRDLHIQPGNYGNGETHETVYQKVATIDLQQSPSPLEVFNNRGVRPFDYSTPEGRLKTLAIDAAFCSIKMSFAIGVGAREGIIPFADASPYTTLLSAKYNRAVAAASPAGRGILATDLSLAMFDEVVPTELLENLEIPEIVKLRKESATAREGFLEHLSALQARIGNVPRDGDYALLIEKTLSTEVRPAAKEFRDKLRTIEERLFGKVAKTAVAWALSPAVVQVFGDITWQKILGLAGGAVAVIAGEAIDAHIEKRAARRDSVISYLFDIEQRARNQDKL